MSFFPILQGLSCVIVIAWLVSRLATSLFLLSTKRLEKARQQQEQEEGQRAARRECSRLLQMEAEEQRLRKKAEHDTLIDLLCDHISMAGIVLRMQMGDALDAEDLAVIQRYQIGRAHV